MQRQAVMALVISLVSLAQAEPEPRAKVKAINANHNSYTYYNYKKPPKVSPPPAKTAEPETAALPQAQAAPVSPPPEAQGYAPAYPQNVNPGVASSTFVYSVSPGAYYAPGYFPYPAAYPGACAYPTPYNGYPGGGIYQGISISGYYNNGNGLTITAGYPPAGACYPGRAFFPGMGPGYAPGFSPGYAPCGPGFSNNLTPQRFDPQPGDHPYSIQMPRGR